MACPLPPTPGGGQKGCEGGSRNFLPSRFTMICIYDANPQISLRIDVDYVIPETFLEEMQEMGRISEEI